MNADLDLPWPDDEPIEPRPDNGPSELEQWVAAAFDVGGPLARSDAGYQPREQQLAMAQAVARTIARRETLVVEAGTRLPLAADLGGGPDDSPDGVPDTTDNNGDLNALLFYGFDLVAVLFQHGWVDTVFRARQRFAAEFEDNTFILHRGV